MQESPQALRTISLAVAFSAVLACVLAVSGRGPHPHSPRFEPRVEAILEHSTAWDAYLDAVQTLHETGNRRLAARKFDAVATNFADSQFASASVELGQILKKMAVEDSRRRIPANVTGLPVNQQIAFHIFNLRNVSIYQGGWPMRCSVLLTTKPNSATELVRIGEPAVPAVIALLRDSRPTRSVALWRPWHHSRTVLRYQDAAVDILEAILHERIYDPVSVSQYLSTDSTEIQEQVIMRAEAAAASVR